jgi:hypothetical protein
MLEISLGIFGGSLISYCIYTEFKYYNKYKNYQLLIDEDDTIKIINEKTIEYLIYILKKEMKTLPKQSSLNLNEKNRLIIHITNIINKISNNKFIYEKKQLNKMIDYLKNPEIYRDKCLKFEKNIIILNKFRKENKVLLS